MPAQDEYLDRQGAGLMGSARRAFAITPGASKLTYVTRGIWVGVGGSITVRLLDDGDTSTPVVIANIPDGTLLPIRASFVTAATATGLIGLA